MACLRDIQSLLGKPNPFYAGFGNRMADALSYRSVGVPSSRIFTIDSTAEVKMELLEYAGYRSSYIHMTDLVDHFFPPIGLTFQEEYTDLLYWKVKLPELSDDEDRKPKAVEEEEDNDEGDDNDEPERESSDIGDVSDFEEEEEEKLPPESPTPQRRPQSYEIGRQDHKPKVQAEELKIEENPRGQSV